MSSFEDSLSKDTGYSIRIYNLSIGLAKRGNEVCVIIPKYETAYEEIGGLKVHSIKGFLPRKFLYAIGRLFGVAKPTSLYFYDLLFLARTIKIIREVDAVQIEQQPAGGLLVPFLTIVLKKPVVADCHDTFQALRVKHTSKIRKFLETFLEMITYEFADVLVTVSEREKALLVSNGIKQDRIEVVPNGVDTEMFNAVADVLRVRSRYGLGNSRIVVFVGNMEYLPNREAVELIASKIAPLVRKHVNDAKFLIVGRIRAKMDLPGLLFTGIVGNVAELLAVSDVAIAPLLHGSGTRLKILEYFSCGLPVVCTTVGAEGLNVENNVHVLIEDDFSEFAFKVVKLLNDRAFARRLGKSARDFVVNEYEWKISSERLIEVYSNLAKAT